MTLILAHRILIGAAVLMLVLYGIWEVAHAGGHGSIGRGVVAFGAAAALAVYFFAIGRLYGSGRGGTT